jgi:hypothetical protein
MARRRKKIAKASAIMVRDGAQGKHLLAKSRTYQGVGAKRRGRKR